MAHQHDIPISTEDLHDLAGDPCCEQCGHFHPDQGPCLDPDAPCGDYRCCIN